MKESTLLDLLELSKIELERKKVFFILELSALMGREKFSFRSFEAKRSAVIPVFLTTQATIDSLIHHSTNPSKKRAMARARTLISNIESDYELRIMNQKHMKAMMFEMKDQFLGPQTIIKKEIVSVGVTTATKNPDAWVNVINHDTSIGLEISKWKLGNLFSNHDIPYARYAELEAKKMKKGNEIQKEELDKRREALQRGCIII